MDFASNKFMEAQIDITVDKNQVNKALKSSEDLVKRSVQRMKRVVSKISTSITTSIGNIFKNLIRNITNVIKIGTLAIAGYIAYATKQSSDFEMQLRKFSVVFRTVEKDAKKFAKKFANDVGLSIDLVYSKMSELQDLFVPMGFERDESLEMVENLFEKIVDIAEFNGKKVEDVFINIQSGLVGSYEPLRRYGIILSEQRLETLALAEGIDLTNRQLTEQEKIQLRIQAIMQDSTDSIGYATDNMNTFAAQLRLLRSNFTDLTIQIGNAFKPVFLELFTTINDLIKNSQENISNFMDKLKEVVGIAGEITAEGFKLLIDNDYRNEEIDGSTRGQKYLKGFAELFGKISKSFITNPITNILTAILERIGDVLVGLGTLFVFFKAASFLGTIASFLVQVLMPILSPFLIKLAGILTILHIIHKTVKDFWKFTKTKDEHGQTPTDSGDMGLWGANRQFKEEKGVWGLNHPDYAKPRGYGHDVKPISTFLQEQEHIYMRKHNLDPEMMKEKMSDTNSEDLKKNFEDLTKKSFKFVNEKIRAVMIELFGKGEIDKSKDRSISEILSDLGIRERKGQRPLSISDSKIRNILDTAGSRYGYDPDKLAEDYRKMQTPEVSKGRSSTQSINEEISLLREKMSIIEEINDPALYQETYNVQNKLLDKRIELLKNDYDISDKILNKWREIKESQYLVEINWQLNSMKNILESSQTGMETLVKSVMTGAKNMKDAFKDFSRFLYDVVMGAIAKLIAQWILFQAITGVGAVVGQEASGTLKQSMNLTDPFSAPPPKAMAKGGVVDNPTLTLMGEAGSEAVVPLPDGKSIPVRMEGGQGDVEVNVINKTEKPVDVESSRTYKDSMGKTVTEVILKDFAQNGMIKQNIKSFSKKGR